MAFSVHTAWGSCSHDGEGDDHATAQTPSLACDVDSADGGQPLSLPPLLKRKFHSYEAAISYVKRLILGRLKRVRHDAVGSDLTYSVNVLPPGEKK